MFGTFSRQPNNFNKQNFIDIIENNGRCFPAGNNGLVPLIIVIINRKSSGWKRSHAQKCSPGFGLSIFVVGDCFSLSTVLPPRFISHLLSCSLFRDSFLNATPCFKNGPCRPPAFYYAVKIIQVMLCCAFKSAGREKSEREAELWEMIFFLF